MTAEPMRVVSGEVVVLMDESAARRLDGRIRRMAGSVRDQLETLYKLISEAKVGATHSALGFASWTAYVADVFAAAPLHLEREQRRELVGYLDSEGMSTRAISRTVGAARNTVRDDLRQVGQFDPPAEDDYADLITGSDDDFEAALAESRAEGDLSRENVASKLPAPRVAGLDGKVYPPKPPNTPKRRRPLPDAFHDAVFQLEKVTEKVERLLSDDRFERHAEELAHRYLHAAHRAESHRAPRRGARKPPLGDCDHPAGSISPRGGELMTAAEELTQAVQELVLDGDVIPCGPEPAPWYADHPVMRAEAAQRCIGCPALNLCASVADEAGERWGVWGGRDHQVRSQQAGAA